METQQPTQSAATFKAIQFVHGAFCASLILFMMVCYSIAKNPHTNISGKDQPLLFASLIMAAAMVFMSNALYNKKVAQIDLALTTSAKLMQCNSLYFPLGDIGIGGLFNIVVKLLTGNLIALILAIAMILYMILLRPPKAGTTALLQISYPDTLDQFLFSRRCSRWR